MYRTPKHEVHTYGPSTQKVRQEDGYEFQASLGYTVREILPHQTAK